MLVTGVAQVLAAPLAVALETKVDVRPLALGRMPPAQVADASGLALIDTVIFSRSAAHAGWLAAQLRHGNSDVAATVGIPRAIFQAMAGQPLDAAAQPWWGRWSGDG